MKIYYPIKKTFRAQDMLKEETPKYQTSSKQYVQGKTPTTKKSNREREPINQCLG